MFPVNKLRVDTRLTTVSIGYQPEGLVADAFAPILLVEKQAGTILEGDKSNLLIDPSGDDRIGQGEPPPLIKGGFTERTYSTFERARGVPVHDDEVDADSAEDAPLEVLVQATELASDRLLLNREARVAALATATANWGSNTSSPGTKWDAAGGTPAADVSAAKATARAGGTMPTPNSMIIPWEVLEAMRFNAEVKAYFSGGATVNALALLDQGILSRIFGVPNIYIAGASAINANMKVGSPSAAATSLWGDNVVLFYRAARPGRRTVSTAYTYVWKNAFRGAARNARGQVVTRDYKARERTLIIDARTYSDEQLLMPEAGYLISNVLT